MSLDENEVYEVQVYTRKYQIETCFTCQKCLYCGKDRTFEECLCNKYEKPTKNNRTAKVRGYSLTSIYRYSIYRYTDILLKT